jgi:hypothetical protein
MRGWELAVIGPLKRVGAILSRGPGETRFSLTLKRILKLWGRKQERFKRGITAEPCPKASPPQTADTHPPTINTAACPIP